LVELKFAASVGVATLLTGGAATVAVSETINTPTLTAREIISRTEAAYAALSSYSDDGRVEATMNGGTQLSKFTIRLARPELYLVEWTSQSPAGPVTGAMWSTGKGHYLKNRGEQQLPNLQANVTQASLLSQNVAGVLPGAFFGLEWGNTLGAISLAPRRLADEKIGRVDCYVLTRDMGGMTPTIWIGKKDHLIRQVRTVFSGDPVAMPDLTDDQIRELLVAHGDPATQEAIAQMRAGLQTANQAMQQVPMNGLVGQIIETHEHIQVNRKFEPSDFAGD
jgi:outer membrane lipoprotein-sorting protein